MIIRYWFHCWCWIFHIILCEFSNALHTFHSYAPRCLGDGGGWIWGGWQPIQHQATLNPTTTNSGSGSLSVFVIRHHAIVVQHRQQANQLSPLQPAKMENKNFRGIRSAMNFKFFGFKFFTCDALCSLCGCVVLPPKRISIAFSFLQQCSPPLILASQLSSLVYTSTRRHESKNTRRKKKIKKNQRQIWKSSLTSWYESSVKSQKWLSMSQCEGARTHDCVVVISSESQIFSVENWL